MSNEIKFSNDWFERTRPIWERHLLQEEPIVNRYLELGVCEGASMRWVIDNLNPGTAIGVDPWTAPRRREQAPFDVYKTNCFANLSNELTSGLCKIYEEESVTWIANQLKSKAGRHVFDMIYVDGDHGGAACLTDMMMAYHLLATKTHDRQVSTIDKNGNANVLTRCGGVMVIDDLQRFFHHGKPLVKIAVHAFEQVMHGKMHKIWEDGRQCAFVRLD